MFASGPIPECLVREVASTPTAFERDLRKAWPAGVDSQGEGIFRLVDGELMLEVAIVPAGVRRIGLLALDLLAVTYRFSGADEPARRRLLTTLDRAMQRGGG